MKNHAKTLNIEGLSNAFDAKGLAAAVDPLSSRQDLTVLDVQLWTRGSAIGRADPSGVEAATRQRASRIRAASSAEPQGELVF
jgi:hypothetical protein